MDNTVFSEAIQHYYATESLSGFIVAGSGLLLAIVAALFLRITFPEQYIKGFFIALLIGGIFFMIGGGLSGYTTKRNAVPKYQAYESAPGQFLKVELNKVEQVHKAWKMIFISWLVPVAVGLLLLILKKGHWRGFGLGLLLIAVLGHIEEVISYKRNETYRNQVLSYDQAIKSIKNN